jgi:hypothetical protein
MTLADFVRDAASRSSWGDYAELLRFAISRSNAYLLRSFRS